MKKILIENKNHFFVGILFLVLCFVYFSPMLSGNVMIGGDTKNWIASSKDLKEYNEKYKKRSAWNGSMFSGMPAYMISAASEAPLVIKIFNSPFEYFPKPAGYLFFLFLSFYVLLLSFKVDYRLSLLGSIMFGFSSYFIIIIGVGHVTKVNTIFLTIFMIAGINYLLNKKYLLGFILTSYFAILSIKANHPQMSYYYGFSIGILYFIKFLEYKKQDIKHYLKSALLSVLAVFIGILVHMVNLLPVNEYTKETIRGKSNLTIDIEEQKDKTKGLDRSYITAWSYGKMESLNMFIPNLFGGGSDGFDKKSKIYKEVVKSYQKGEINQNDANTLIGYARKYWGPQPFTEGPTYIGSIVIFLFVLGFFILKGKLKWWLILSTLLSIMMAWGKNISWFTDFMIDYFPLYNKFRAPASALVLAQMTIPLMAILALKEFLSNNDIKLEDKYKYFKYTSIITLGVCIIFGLGGIGLLEYIGSSYDNIYENAPQAIKQALINDREDIAKSDSWRAFILVLLCCVSLYLFLKQKLNYKKVVLFIGLLVLFDMWGIDKRYLNDGNFIPKNKQKQIFTPSYANKEIMKDTTYYRVMNTTRNIMSDSETSYWHNSIGGYHGAKLRRYQELYDMQISKQNMEVLNMLNTKYFIVQDNNTGDKSILNTETNGNAWLVNKYIYVNNSDEEIKVLDTLKTKEYIVLDKEYQSILGDNNFDIDNKAYIKLVSHNLQELRYDYFSEKDQIAVFSEIYYKYGWNAYLDGNIVPHFRANYVLRAMKLPSGKHNIVFKFEPESIKKGKKLTYIGLGIFFISVIILGLFERKKIIN